jgi:hypothetical protein
VDLIERTLAATAYVDTTYTDTNSFTTKTIWVTAEVTPDGRFETYYEEAFSVPDTKELLDENEV